MTDLERRYRRYYVHLRGIQQELAKTKARLNPPQEAAAPQDHNLVLVPDSQFTEIVDDEVQKVNHFANLKQQELIMEIQIAAKNLNAFISILSGGPGSSTQGQNVNTSMTAREARQSAATLLNLTEQEKQSFLADMECLLTEVSREIVHLHRYVRVNFTYLCRASLVFDELFGRSTSAWFMAQLLKEPFASCDVDRLLVRLSLCWEKYRQATAVSKGTLKTGSEGPWKPPESFIRNTTKYWVRPNQVAAAKAFIIKYVPYLIFGFSSKEMEFMVNPLALSATGRHDESEVKEGQLVSSVYLDSEGGYSYYNRLSRFEGAQLLRCRWYGENDGDPYKEIFIERKTHHEGWSGDNSAKERFSLPQKRVFDFLKGKVDIDEWAENLAASRGLSKSDKKIANLLRLGKDISSIITKHKLQPMVRTSYLRSAFQASDNNDVRFSLDVNLCMVDEFQPNFHPDPPWCRTAEEVLGKDQVVRFPFAVLEVKLQREQPAWVSQMLHESQAMMVYKFSKFQHGMAFLHRDKIGHYGLPHWIPEFENRGYVPGFSIPPPSTKRDATVEVGPGFSSSAHLATRSNVPAWNLRQFEPLSLSSSDASPPWRRLRAEPSSARYGAKANVREESRRSLLLGSFYPGAKRSFTDSTSLHLRIQGKATSGMGDEATTNYLEAIHSRSLNITKLDPKSVFAAERTFLHYVHKALYIAGGGIAILTWGSSSWLSKSLGILLVFTACVGFVASYAVLLGRMSKILNRTTKALYRERLDDERAPLITSGVMGGVLSLVLLIEICSQTGEGGM